MSRNPNNTEEDFNQYKNDKEMAEVINRLRKDKLPPDEFKYVSDILSYEVLMVHKDQEHKAELSRQKRLAFKHQQKAEQEKQVIEQEKQVIELKLIKLLLQQGSAIQTIAATLEISVEETEELIKLIEKNNG